MQVLSVFKFIHFKNFNNISI